MGWGMTRRLNGSNNVLVCGIWDWERSAGKQIDKSSERDYVLRSYGGKRKSVAGEGSARRAKRKTWFADVEETVLLISQSVACSG